LGKKSVRSTGSFPCPIFFEVVPIAHTPTVYPENVSNLFILNITFTNITKIINKKLGYDVFRIENVWEVYSKSNNLKYRNYRFNFNVCIGFIQNIIKGNNILEGLHS